MRILKFRVVEHFDHFEVEYLTPEYDRWIAVEDDSFSFSCPMHFTSLDEAKKYIFDNMEQMELNYKRSTTLPKVVYET